MEQIEQYLSDFKTKALIVISQNQPVGQGIKGSIPYVVSIKKSRNSKVEILDKEFQKIGTNILQEAKEKINESELAVLKESIIKWANQTITDFGNGMI